MYRLIKSIHIKVEKYIPKKKQISRLNQVILFDIHGNMKTTSPHCYRNRTIRQQNLKNHVYIKT